MLMAFFREQATEVRPAMPQESPAVSQPVKVTHPIASRLAPVFSAPVQQRSIPSRAQLAHERHPCSCRSNRKWSELWWLRRAQSSKHPHVFLRAFLRNYFHAAPDQLSRARSSRKARKEARSRAMWTKERATGQLLEEIPRRPFQFVNFRDSIKRGSRMGKREVLGTTRK